METPDRYTPNAYIQDSLTSDAVSMTVGIPGIGRHSVSPEGGCGRFITDHPEDRFTATVQRESYALSHVQCTRRRLYDLARSSVEPRSLAARCERATRAEAWLRLRLGTSLLL